MPISCAKVLLCEETVFLEQGHTTSQAMSVGNDDNTGSMVLTSLL